MLNSLAGPRALLFQTGADRIKLASRTELFVFVGDEIGVLFNKYLLRHPEIELFGLIAEVFAMNARPDKPSIGVDVYFSDAEPGGRQIFFFIHAARRWIKFVPSGIDALDL
jgi:hypothetical protein